MLKRLRHPGCLFALAAIAYAAFVAIQLTFSYWGARYDQDRIKQIVASEELILQLNDKLREFNRSVKNLQLPDIRAQAVVTDELRVKDLASEKPSDTTLANVNPRAWQIASERKVSRTELSLWSTLFDVVDYFESSKFYFISGEVTGSELDHFSSNVGFKGRARLEDGRWVGIKAAQKVDWRRTSGDEWLIESWSLTSFQTFAVRQLTFSEVLDQAIPNPVELENARRSTYQRHVTEFYENGGQLPWRYFTPISANQRPGISVVDINQDSYDDFYVVVRRGPNQLFVNQKDGTFDEQAAQWGLDIRDFNSCAIFADFDNDGDQDLFLGRSIARSLYLENQNGHFKVVDGADGSESPLPYLVVSMSAADYNNDGLLDIYFSTYRPAVLESLVSSGETTSESGSIGDIASTTTRWNDEFLSPNDAKEYVERLANTKKDESDFSSILNQIGPPNVLLINQGNGRFEVAPESPQLAVWRNTLQATWADFDEDGDPDLYVANDWAPDHLFLNNGKNGFQDVTELMGVTEFGFAMGVTWGDYDRDGYQDIYVSNMYSKAGRRITRQIAELDPSYPSSVNGNFLYRGSADGFSLVSGLAKPAVLVAEAGWSWGGQFADFDNDGFLDLYVLSGYFTAPDKFSSNVDL